MGPFLGDAAEILHYWPKTSRAAAKRRFFGENIARKMVARVRIRFARMDLRFARVRSRFARVDFRFARMDFRFARYDRQWESLREVATLVGGLTPLARLRRLATLSRVGEGISFQRLYCRGGLMGRLNDGWVPGRNIASHELGRSVGDAD